MRTSLAPVAALVVLIGCGRSTEVNVTVDTAAAAPALPDAMPPAAPSAPPADSAALPPASDAASWTVTPDGIGPVRVGMTTAEVRRLVGAEGQVDEPSQGSTCAYANWGSARPGIAYMLTDGRVARVDVSPYIGAGRDRTVPAAQLPKTAEGVGVGSTVDDVRLAYGARLRVGPHNYVPGGSYLWLPVADTVAQAFVLETDETGVVTSLRAGKRPEAEWVEGCS